MSSMYYEYMEVLREETLKSTQSMENWLNYLDGASRNFKYGFSEQLLINCQKPNATAIADYDTWNGRLGRVVKTGTAMYLPVNIGGKLTVKNYFDAADTIAKATSTPLPQWGYSAEHETAVMEHIANQHNMAETLETDTDLGAVMDSVYDKASRRYLLDNLEAINKAFRETGVYSDISDKYEMEQAFETCVYASTALVVNKRLGIRPEMEEALIGLIQPYLHHFRATERINALGSAVSSLSEEYLRSVETAVKAFDREQAKIKKERDFNEGVHPDGNGQDGLLRAADQRGIGEHDGTDERGRHDFQPMDVQPGNVVHNGADGQERPHDQDAVPQHSAGRGTSAAETVGHGADGLLEGTQQILGGADGNNRASQALSGNRGTGRATQEVHDGGLPERPGQQSHREGQSPRPDGVGRPDEQLSGEDSRNNQQRPDLRLNSQNSTAGEALANAGAFSMPEIPLADVLNDREEMIRRIIADILHHDPGHPPRSLAAIEDDYRHATMESMRESYFFYFPNDQPELEAEQAPEVTEISDLGAFSSQNIPPMFVVDWKEAQYDFDLGLYEDGDMVAYDKDGVSFKVSKMGEHNFITSTTSITPIGEILGDKDIPSYIRNEMRAYWNGDITAEQVREETLQRLDFYKSQTQGEITQNEATHNGVSWQEYFDLHSQYPEKHIFIRSGDYFEAYDADAVLLSHSLKLPIEQREIAGSPVGAVKVVRIRSELFEDYAKRLLDEGSDIVVRDAQGNIEVRSLNTTEEIGLPNDGGAKKYPISISHSPLLKGWYDALEQDEELTVALACGFNKMLSKGLTITRQGQLEAAFEKMSAPILQQSKLTDAAYKVFDNKDAKIELQRSISFGSLGNGLTVWDRLNENPETRDYENLAHIDFDRNITWYTEDLPEEIKARITETAETSNDSSFISLGTHGERKKWLSMINEMVSANGFISKEDFSYTPFNNHGGLSEFINLYGIEGYERVLNRINKEAMPQGLDNLHKLFKEQYPDRVIAVAAKAGFVDVRNIPASTGLSLSVKEGFFRRRVSGSEYGDLLKSLRAKGIAVVSVYPESGEIFAHKPDEAVAREVEPTLSPMGNKTDELQQGTILGENQHIENVDGVDFVFTTVREGEQPDKEAISTAKPEPFMVIDNVSRSNYNLFALAFPQIANGSYRDMTFHNEQTKQELSVFHDTTTAGLVHFTISSYAPDATMVYDPMITFRANFENRMLTPIQYANTVRKVDIGYLSVPSPDDNKRLEAESIGIYELLADIKKRGFELVEAEPFKDAQGNPLPSEPKPSLEAFLKEQANREAAAHAYVQQSMFHDTQAQPQTPDTKPLKYDVDKIYDYVKSKNLDNRAQNRLLDEIKQNLNTAQFVSGIGRKPTLEEAADADLWLKERHPNLYKALSDEVSEQAQSAVESDKGYTVGQRVSLDLRELSEVDFGIPTVSEYTITGIAGDTIRITNDNGKEGLQQSSGTWSFSAAEIKQYTVQPNAGERQKFIARDKAQWEDYSAVKEQNPNKILFQSVFTDDYYEAMGDDARIVADVMGLPLVMRDIGGGETLPVTGVYYLDLNKYAGRLHINNGDKGNFGVITKDLRGQIKTVERNHEFEQEFIVRQAMLQDYQSIKNQHPSDVLIYKHGNRYEVIGSDAMPVGELLNIFYSNSDVGLAEWIPRASFPDNITQDKLNEYAQTLTEAGYGVIIRHGEGEIETRSRNTHEEAVPHNQTEQAQDSTFQGTPLWQDYQFLKDKNPNMVLFYRLGDFYEVLGRDAKLVADTLDISLTARDVGLAERIPLAGVPQHKLDEYVKTLISAGFGVAIRHGQDELETRSRNIWHEPEPEQAQFIGLQAVEAELDRKIALMHDHPDYEKISEAANYWKTWRTLSHRVGIAADALVEQINGLDDSKAVEWLSSVPWDNWREALDIGDFEPLSAKIRREDASQTEVKAPPAKNFRMDSIDYASITAGGAKSKFKRNIEAIRTLQAIEADERTATPEEQEILAHYVGWGGISEAFQPRNQQWQAEHNELKSLLSPDEYQAARSSVLTAYYTEPTIMNAMWDKVEQLGGFRNYGNNLNAVNILEPSAGVGNFFGVMPEHLNEKANIHGVELDSISGRIARHLYPNAKIQIKGFEKTQFQDDFFDAVIGNVPFSDSIKPVDWRYDKEKFLVHDYFFNKALDKVRPGGVVAFITSAGTLDKIDDKARIAMAEKAELLGAIRLPNDAFKANAGTEVVSDIIFMQKREEPLDLSKSNVIPDSVSWVQSVVTRESGMNEDIGKWMSEQRRNSYFVDNPHMILGEYATVSSQYGLKDTVLPKDGADLGEQLREAMAHIAGSIPVREIPEPEIEEETATKFIEYNHELDGFFDSAGRYIDVKDSSYVVVDGEVYFRNNYRLGIVAESATALERIKGMVSLRDTLRELIQAQVDDRPQVEIEQLQKELNTKYDTFTKKHGLITAKANETAFDNDDSYYLLTSLEKLNDELEFEGKSDIFTKRTIKPHVEITAVNNSGEALGVSIGYRGKVDLEYMAQLTGFDKERIINDLEGVIFLDARYHYDDDDIGIIETTTERYIPADEYLSGNVREKLARARDLAEIDPRFAVNVSALEKAQPVDLEAHEIYVRLGTTWIDRKYVQQFMYEILDTPNAYKAIHKEGEKAYSWNSPKRDEKERMTVQYSPLSNEWRVTNKNAIAGSNIKADVEYGTSRINAYHIMEQTLNLKEVVVKDKVRNHENKEVEVVNEEETTLARQKQEDLKNAFRDWIFKDPERREALVSTYNERFNAIRPREYDGSHIVFAGMTSEITLEEHQVNAVARVMYGGNTLLAHEVGAGKSFEMIAAAMESKRIGQCTKSLIAVPKHLTGQMASEFLRLYPNANILVATDKTFEKKNRKRFCSKIATGNYDAIIMGHTQFEMIQLSVENQEKYYREQFDLLVEAIAEAKAADSGYFTVKQMENTKNKVKTKLDNLYKDGKKDDVITFEQLGVDKLFVDESHSFKNLHLYTKMRNVAGISQTEAQKSADMFMKCRYLDEETGGKGVTFATGTPISNSLTEMYTVQRYLQFNKLEEMNLVHFDQWASIFTEPTSDMELAPEGSGYRMRTRCARFQNLPELMNTFFEVADIKTAESLNLPRPEANFHTVSCEPTEIQKEMIQALSERADAVRNRQVKPHEDNMLAVTNDGRKLGLDQRVINPNLPDEPTSKINQATENIFNIWEKTKEDRLTQVVFCDLSTPSAKNKKEHGFNVYDDVKNKLIERGVPANEIAFVHDYNSDKQKQQLFAKVRAGTIRVVFGSTEKMGAGTNIQDKLVALHHLDCPWRPSDLAQREGRILRRGNNNKEIDIYKYVTKDTFDAYLYQTIEKKQQFISQIMTEKSPMRTVDDVDQSVLDYAEIKALCVGNPKIKEKMDLEQDLKKLNALHSQYKKNLYRMETALLKTYPAQIKAKERNIENYQADTERLAKGTQKVSEGISAMVIDGTTFTERVKAGEAIKAACQSVDTTEGVKIGTYRGFELHLSFDKWGSDHVLTARGDMAYPIKLEGNFSTQGVVTRLDNALDKIPEYITAEKESLENAKEQMKAAEIEVAKPFPREAEIAEKTARVTQLNVELSLDAQKAQKAAEAPEVEEIDGEDLEYGEDEPDFDGAEVDDAEYVLDETEFDDAGDYDVEVPYMEQSNAETITETFETAENGGQGAFVSGDIHHEKTTEKVSTVPDSLQQMQKAVPNNIYVVGIKPTAATEEKAAAPIQQAEQKPVKPKRNYHDR